MTNLRSIGHAIMAPLYFVTTFTLVTLHDLYALLGLPAGASWTLAIISLTVGVQILLIPLFLRHVKNTRDALPLHPKVQELQDKYGDDRVRLRQETMKLYKDSGVNPFASCLPLLLQIPIFLALFRTLNQAATGNGISFLTTEQATSLQNSIILGNVWLSDSLRSSHHPASQVFAVGLIILITAATVATHRLTYGNLPEYAMTGQYAQQQRILLYVLPVIFALGAVAFPIGVLLYWTTSSLWSMGQRVYLARHDPWPPPV